jgi:hypothetical protein
MKKTILKTTMTLALVLTAALFTGCEQDKQTFKTKKGVSCEDRGALEVLKSIVDKKFNGDFEIEKDNIVVWDYNSVGRYSCRAKIKKVGEQKTKKSASKNADMDALMAMSQLFAPAQYGIGEKGGWINYYTYETTTSSKKNRSLYVEIYTDDAE